MMSVLLQMAATIAMGLLWRRFEFGGWSAERARGALTTAVYYFFLPALVLAVLWRTPLGADTFKISLSAATGVLVSMAAMVLVGRMMTLTRPQFGALLLAASFPNATYMGLPLLASLFGDPGKAVAIQYDLFACTPLLLSVGIMLAARFGNHSEQIHPVKSLLRVPPLWAAVVGSLLNLTGVPQPDWAAAFLDRMGGAVVPIMLIALGMSLRVATLLPRHLSMVSPVLIIQLILMPIAVLLMATLLGLTGDLRMAVILEGAMPVMVIGLVLCDRFGLDTEMFATAATASTVLALLTLPLWHYLLT
ncbi:MAG: AEC family transporter [Halothiobacillus sp.]|jgi:predicted permease|uniref:AEC family transporter n=1 Tax=Halothiobacillus sp. TaxID=1891311 RepID=UPI002AD54506|nr:AEC family transporter [Halothiobacillus sp.]MDA3875902.1 AEC family transporter [Halothiobacillus sp.]